VYRKTFEQTLQQIDLALLVREMREDAGFTQTELAKKVGTTQSVIARLEDAEYAGPSLTMLERADCGGVRGGAQAACGEEAEFRARGCARVKLD